MGMGKVRISRSFFFVTLHPLQVHKATTTTDLFEEHNGTEINERGQSDHLVPWERASGEVS